MKASDVGVGVGVRVGNSFDGRAAVRNWLDSMLALGKVIGSQGNGIPILIKVFAFYQTI